MCAVARKATKIPARMLGMSLRQSQRKSDVVTDRNRFSMCFRKVCELALYGIPSCSRQELIDKDGGRLVAPKANFIVGSGIQIRGTCLRKADEVFIVIGHGGFKGIEVSDF